MNERQTQKSSAKSHPKLSLNRFPNNLQVSCQNLSVYFPLLQYLGANLPSTFSHHDGVSQALTTVLSLFNSNSELHTTSTPARRTKSPESGESNNSLALSLTSSSSSML